MDDVTPETIYVTNGLNGGGAERLLTNLVLQQSDRDRSFVISLSPGGVFRRTLENAGIRVIDLGMTRRRHALRALFALAAEIRKRRPIAVYGWQYDASMLALFARILAGRPKTRLFWGVFCTDISRGAFHPFFRVLRRISALTSRWVTGVIYNAEEAMRYHHEIGYREPLSLVISNCVDPEQFHPEPEQRALLRAELGISLDAVVVVMVARVDPMKDWSTVLDAVRGLPGVITVAVGKGTDELPPQPGFLGLGWRDDVVHILSAADIFLLGSAFGEGTSLALEEAMLCGLPSVITDVGGNATLAGETGIVVAPRDVAAIRAAIAELANDRERRERLGRIARERAAAAESRCDTPRRLQQLSMTSEATP
jgi:glycosyltransferase involved in cell wall biosynthesis